MATWRAFEVAWGHGKDTALVVGSRAVLCCILRHTLALMFLKNGRDPYTLQYLLVHKDMGTVREYVKIAAQDAKEMYRSPLDALE